MLLSELLKEKTSSDHDRLEKQMYVNQIFARRLSFAQYCDLIHVNFTVISAIEENIFSALPENLQNRLEVEKRKKLPSLEKDVQALQLYKYVMHHPHKPKYSNAPEALGGMYVMEGATLGGNVIVRRLKEIPELKDQSFHFYNVYGESVGDKWLDFKQVLDGTLAPEDFEQCLGKANETFGFYHKVAVNIMNDVSV